LKVYEAVAEIVCNVFWQIMDENDDGTDGRQEQKHVVEVIA
jgi:hypothetical protein